MTCMCKYLLSFSHYISDSSITTGEKVLAIYVLNMMQQLQDLKDSA